MEQLKKKQSAALRCTKNYYVKVGNRPQLPAELDVILNDKSEAKRKVTVGGTLQKIRSISQVHSA